MIGSKPRSGMETAEPMECLAVRCRSCQKEFVVESIGRTSEAAPFRRPSFKASYTCPDCHATHDYTSGDLMLSAGSIANNPQCRAG